MAGKLGAVRVAESESSLAEFSRNGLRRWARGGDVLPVPALVNPTDFASRSERPDDAHLRALVVRVRNQDLSAFEQLYRLTRVEVARTLFHLVGQRVEMEDLLQETYLRLLSAVKSFRGDSQFRTFLYRICANVAFSHLRWSRRRREDLVPEVPEQTSAAADPESEAAQRQAAALVHRALESLTPKKRVVFVYHELCGMGPEEIAVAVGTSANTVRSRLHHARIEFAEAMKRVLAAPARPRRSVSAAPAIKAQGGLDGAA